MKRVFLCMIIVALVCTGCKSSAPSSLGMIQPVELSLDQQKVITLLSDQHELLLFDYDSKEEFTHFEVWVEIYKKGELVAARIAPLEMMTTEPSRFQGQLAINISQTPEFRWQISDVKDGGIRSGASETSKLYDAGIAQAYGSMEAPAEIEGGKEILLYSRVFSSSPEFRFINKQTDLEEAEELADYTYAHLIKCKFY